MSIRLNDKVYSISKSKGLWKVNKTLYNVAWIDGIKKIIYVVPVNGFCNPHSVSHRQEKEASVVFKTIEAAEEECSKRNLDIEKQNEIMSEIKNIFENNSKVYIVNKRWYGYTLSKPYAIVEDLGDKVKVINEKGKTALFNKNKIYNSREEAEDEILKRNLDDND